MKEKIGVEIHKNGSENDVLLRMVGNVNESGVKISPENIAAYLMVRNAMFPILFKFSFKQDKNSFHISEDGGETFTLSLTWKEVEELAPVDDIPGELYQSNGAN